MHRPVIVFLKAFATICIIAPWAMVVMTSFVLLMVGYSHPLFLLAGLCVYCTAEALWKPDQGRMIRFGLIIGLAMLSWLIWGFLTDDDPRFAIHASNKVTESVRKGIAYYLVFSAWLLNLILLVLPASLTTSESTTGSDTKRQNSSHH